jgi:hypothetical protein
MSDPVHVIFCCKLHVWPCSCYLLLCKNCKNMNILRVYLCYFKQFLPPFLKFNYHGIIGPWNTYSLSVYCILVLWNTFLFAGNQFKWFFGLTLIQYELWEKLPLKMTVVRSILLLIYSYYYQFLFLISIELSVQ